MLVRTKVVHQGPTGQESQPSWTLLRSSAWEAASAHLGGTPGLAAGLSLRRRCELQAGGLRCVGPGGLQAHGREALVSVYARALTVVWLLRRANRVQVPSAQPCRQWCRGRRHRSDSQQWRAGTGGGHGSPRLGRPIAIWIAPRGSPGRLRRAWLRPRRPGGGTRREPRRAGTGRRALLQDVIHGGSRKRPEQRAARCTVPPPLLSDELSGNWGRGPCGRAESVWQCCRRVLGPCERAPEPRYSANYATRC